MTLNTACSCGTICYNLVFACAGAADVGAIADRSARKLTQEKRAFMCCTAAIAAEIPEILEKAAFANKIVAIDGCDTACVKKILNKGGFTELAHVELGALGFEKGKTPANEQNIALAVDAAIHALESQTTQ